MDIEKLESFLMLAKIQNYAEAAERLYISQPALSKRIQSLEHEMNAPLFNRMGGSTYLTVQGERFKSFAEEMVATYNKAYEYIRQMEELETGKLNFGATNFIGVYLIPEYLARYQALHEKIEINMTINASRTILDMLSKNQLEFVLLSDYVLEENDLYDIHPFYSDELKLIVGNRHRLFAKETCLLEELKDDLYISKNRRSSQFKFLDKSGISFNKQMFISNQEAIKECVVHNVGISILSPRMVEREIQEGLVSALSIEGLDLRRNIQLVMRKDQYITPAAKAFLALINRSI